MIWWFRLSDSRIKLNFHLCVQLLIHYPSTYNWGFERLTYCVVNAKEVIGEVWLSYDGVSLWRHLGLGCRSHTWSSSWWANARKLVEVIAAIQNWLELNYSKIMEPSKCTQIKLSNLLRVKNKNWGLWNRKSLRRRCLRKSNARQTQTDRLSSRNQINFLVTNRKDWQDTECFPRERSTLWAAAPFHYQADRSDEGRWIFVFFVWVLWERWFQWLDCLEEVVVLRSNQDLRSTDCASASILVRERSYAQRFETTKYAPWQEHEHQNCEFSHK